MKWEYFYLYDILSQSENLADAETIWRLECPGDIVEVVQFPTAASWSTHANVVELVQGMLNRLGEHGWEICSNLDISQSKDNRHCIKALFKRPLKTPSLSGLADQSYEEMMGISS